MAEAPPQRADVDRALAVLDSYQRQIEMITRQLSMLQSLLNEASRARDTLEGLAKGGSKDLLVPLGANTFLHAQATDTKHVLSGIGAGVTVETTLDLATTKLKERESEIQAEAQRMSEALNRIQNEAASLEEEIQSVVQGGQ